MAWRTSVLSYFLIAAALLPTGCLKSARQKALEAMDEGQKSLAKNDLKSAFAHFNTAVTSDPTYPPALLSRGELSRKGRNRKQAIDDFTAVLALEPNSAPAYFGRGRTQYDAGKIDEATADLELAVQHDTLHDLAPYYLGLCYFKKQKFDDAIRVFGLALKQNRNFGPAHFETGRAYMEKCRPRVGVTLAPADLAENYRQAIKHFGAAIFHDPDNVEARVLRSLAYFEQGEYVPALDDALKQIVEPHEKAPAESKASAAQLAEAYYNIARVYATASDPKFRDAKKAIAAAGKACNLTKNKSWYCLAAGAAAMAEAGEFTRSQKIQKMAIDQAPESERAAMNERLELYRNNKPYHHQPVQATANSQASAEADGPA